MKKLYLVRHAKSSWDYPELTDKQRPLNARGERDAPRMAKIISEKIEKPDILICSTSVRTNMTAEHFLSCFGLSKQEMIQEEGLFHASELGFFSIVARLKEEWSSAMLFGHNPGITSFVNSISGSFIDNIPTCGVAGVHLDVVKWTEISKSTGELDFYLYPKGISG